MSPCVLPGWRTGNSANSIRLTQKSITCKKLCNFSRKALAFRLFSVLQIGVYRSDKFSALFLIRQEKCQKKPTQGALCVALPRAESMNYGAIATGNRPILIRCAEHHPLCIPRRTYDSAEHLNLHPEHGKNVPIFAVLG